MPARKPTRLLELNGAFDKNPARRRNAEPQAPGPLGEPPERLPEAVRAFWHELVSIAPRGVLTASDRWSVELAARLMCKAVNKPSLAAIMELAAKAELTPDDIRQLVRTESPSGAELAQLRSLLGAMGLTPADRSRLSIGSDEKPRNRFAELAAESRRVQ